MAADVNLLSVDISMANKLTGETDSMEFDKLKVLFIGKTNVTSPLIDTFDTSTGVNDLFAVPATDYEPHTFSNTYYSSQGARYYATALQSAAFADQ